MKKISLLFFITLFFIFNNDCFSQSLTNSLQQLSSDVAKSYISPLISGYGADMNSGWVQRVPLPVKVGFNFSAGVVFMGSFLHAQKLMHKILQRN